MFKKIALLLFLASAADAQTYTIRTFAGGGPIVGQSATSYGVDSPQGVAVDSTGNLYFSLWFACQVWVVNSSGILAQVIGNGACGFSGDGGPAASAALNMPEGIAVDSSGNLYIADSANNRIRKVSGGIITTVAGNGAFGYNGDNIGAISAELADPVDVAVDGSGNLYIAELINERVRKVSGGIITTVAGNGTSGYNGDNISATSAELNGPGGVAVDSSGNLYIADEDNYRVRKVSGGIITTAAGNGTCCSYNGDNIPATSAVLFPDGVAVDTSGNLYITDGNNNSIRKVSAGTITTLAGGLDEPQSITTAGGNVYVADYGDNRIVEVSGGVLTTVVGTGSAFAGGSVATGAEFSLPSSSAVDSSGNLYIAAGTSCLVLKVTAGTGIISAIAGTGVCGTGGDNVHATATQLYYPSGVAADSSGNVYIADQSSRVRKVSGGIITAVAGTGVQGYNGDNISAISAELYQPEGLAVDGSGNLYIADTSNYRIRKVSGGIITTVAGNGTGGYNGDNIGATSAELNLPAGLALDSTGNLYIADSVSSRIRKVSGGTITTVAGNGTFGYNGDNISATSAQLGGPSGVAVDSGGNIYITDNNNQRIRKVSGGIITTVAGDGMPGFSGDYGLAVQAMLNQPTGVAVDSSGNVYIADRENNRIRRLTADSCYYSLTPSGGASLVAGAFTYSVAVTAPSGCAWTASNDYITWETITSGASGSGSGVVDYSVQANPNSGVRTGYLTIAGINFTLTQAGSGCEVGLTPSSASLGSAGSSGSVSVGLSGSDCQWTTSSAFPGLTITSGGSGTGNGTINYTVSSNTSGVARSGAININVSTTGTQAAFNINQAGSMSCSSYALPQSSQSFSSASNSGSAAVVTPGGCPWTASTNATWLAINSGTSGTGDGTVNYTVQSNPSSAARTGTLTIAGQTYVVNQSGTSGTLSCTASVPSTPPLVAIEGRTEILGNLLLNCTGMSGAITANIFLTLNTSVTNTAGTTAVLTNGSATQNGQVLGYNTVYWPAVTLTPSGGSASVQIGNVRADASLLPVGSGLQVPAITGQLTVNSTVPVPVNNAKQTMANAIPTLAFSSGPATPLADGTGMTLPLIYQEDTTSSFHTAPPATRFRMVLTNVPSYVQVYAPVYPAGGAAQGQLYSADCSGSGGAPVTGSSLEGGTYSQLAVSGGVATATWVVLSADPANFDTLTFPLLLENAGVSDLLKIQVVGSYAPVSPAGVACGSADPSAAVVPRYRDPSVPLTPVNVRLTTSLSVTNNTSQSQMAEMLKPDARLSPLSVGSSIGVATQLTMINESSSQAVTNGVAGGTLATGSNPIGCSAPGGSCAGSGGQFSCTWPSIAPGQSVTCNASGILDPSYPAGSTVSSTTGANGVQPPADTTTTISSSSVVLPEFPPNVLINAPVQSATVSGLTQVSGWAVDLESVIGSVQIEVDGIVVGTATYGSNRQDICSSYPGSPGCPNIGFSYSLNTCPYSNGPHTITALATDTDPVPMPATSTVTVSVQPASYTISGQITVGGVGLGGVTVCIGSTCVVTNASGNYSITLAGCGTYTVTPVLSGYSFSPGNVTFSSLGSNQTANFTATLTTLSGLDFYPVTPCRIADTRTGAGFTGQFGPPTMGAGATRTFNILSSPCAGGIPSTVAAYSLNFTVVPPAGGPAANLTTWPTGQPAMPNVSTLNYYGSVVANAAIVPAGTNSAINVYVVDPTDVLIDINGYFAPPLSSGLEFYPVTPCRIADTRTGAGFSGAYGPPSMAGGTTRTFTISNACGIPATASAYSLNFTVVPPAGGPEANLTAWPSSQGPNVPNVSTLNYYSSVVANAALVPAGTNDAINVYVADPTNVLFDTNGYFAAAQASGLHFYPLPPCRIADTRTGAGFSGQFGPPTMGAGTTRTFTLPASSCGAPPTASAYSLNFTVVPPSGGPEANLTTWPTGLASGMPNVSTLNYYGSVVANAAIVPAGTNGAINVYVVDPTDVLIDINGYFAP